MRKGADLDLFAADDASAVDLFVDRGTSNTTDPLPLSLLSSSPPAATTLDLRGRPLHFRRRRRPRRLLRSALFGRSGPGRQRRREKAQRRPREAKAGSLESRGRGREATPAGGQRGNTPLRGHEGAVAPPGRLGLARRLGRGPSPAWGGRRRLRLRPARALPPEGGGRQGRDAAAAAAAAASTEAVAAATRPGAGPARPRALRPPLRARAAARALGHARRAGRARAGGPVPRRARVIPRGQVAVRGEGAASGHGPQLPGRAWAGGGGEAG